MPPVHDSAVARVRFRARQRSMTISETERSSSPKRYGSSAVTQGGGERGAALGCRGLREDVDVDLELARADRHVHAVALTAGGRECLGDGGLRRAEEPQHAMLRSPAHARGRAAPARSRARGARAAGARAAGRAARRRRTLPCRGRLQGAVPARPREIPPSGSVACLRTPVANSVYERPRRVANACEISPIRRSSSSSRTSGRPATRATSSTVRSSCVGPRPPETRQRSASKPWANALSRSSTRSPTIAIRTGSRPSRTASAARNGPLRSWRSPRTSSEPVTTIAACGRVKTLPGRSSVR